MATNGKCNGGCKPTFAQHVVDACDDCLMYYRGRIEAKEAEIAALTRERDELQEQMYSRWMTLRADSEAHKAVAKHPECRTYPRSQPTVKQLAAPWVREALATAQV